LRHRTVTVANRVPRFALSGILTVGGVIVTFNSGAGLWRARESAPGFGRAHRSTSLGLHPASARRTRGPEIRRLSCLEIRNLEVENPTDSWPVVLENQVASPSMVQPAGIK